MTHESTHDGPAQWRPAGDSAARLRDGEGTRLQKALAAAGVASRRASEDLIRDGRVRVNGSVVTELGSRIWPESDHVSVDGKAVQLDVSKCYVMLNKPTGVVSSLHDEQGRRDLREFTDGFAQRLHNVGRLDADTSGLLILTNDGGLTHVLSHPSFGVSKTYIATVAGSIAPADVRRLATGITLDDGPIAADSIRVLDRSNTPAGPVSLVEVSLHSGRNRIVRRMFDHVGHPVQQLVRRQFGPLTLGTLRLGQVRELTAAEVSELLTMARMSAHRRAAKRAKSEESAVRPGSAGRGRRGAR